MKGGSSETASVAQDVRASQSRERGRRSRCNRPSGRERKKREIDENERDGKEDGKLARRGAFYSRLGGEGPLNCLRKGGGCSCN